MDIESGQSTGEFGDPDGIETAGYGLCKITSAGAKCPFYGT